MRNLYSIAFIAVLLCTVACQDKNASKAPTKNKDSEIETPDLKVPIDDTTTAFTSVLATYVDATVYAGSTDYYFKSRNGEMIKCRVSNYEEDPNLSLPDNLLDPNAAEGPPGGNPTFIGKIFQLTYDVEDKLVQVNYVDK